MNCSKPFILDDYFELYKTIESLLMEENEGLYFILSSLDDKEKVLFSQDLFFYLQTKYDVLPMHYLNKIFRFIPDNIANTTRDELYLRYELSPNWDGYHIRGNDVC